MSTPVRSRVRTRRRTTAALDADARRPARRPDAASPPDRAQLPAAAQGGQQEQQSTHAGSKAPKTQARGGRPRRRRPTTATKDTSAAGPHAAAAPRPTTNPTLLGRHPGPGPDRRPELLHREVPDPAVPAPDLPGRRHRVRHALGGPGRDQRDRDRLRPQPQRLDRRRPGLDAVHARPRGRSTASTPTTTAARTRTTRSTRSSPPRATSRPPAPTRTSARAIFAYNHADWYVDSVLMRARLIGGLPADLVGSLTGLTQGHFPVHAKARYADDISERDAASASPRATTPPMPVEATTTPPRHQHLRQGRLAGRSPTQDGKIVGIGTTTRARPLHPAAGRLRQHLHVRAPQDGRPGLPGAEAARRSSKAAGRQGARAPAQATRSRRSRRQRRHAAAPRPPPAPQGRPHAARRPPRRRRRQVTVAKERLFANPSAPDRLQGRRRGAAPQRATSQLHDVQELLHRRSSASTATTSTLKPLKVGSKVIAGTILGRIGRTSPKRRAARRSSRSARPARAPRGSTRSRSSTAGSCSSPRRSTAPPARTRSSAPTPRTRRSARSC